MVDALNDFGQLGLLANLDALLATGVDSRGSLVLRTKANRYHCTMAPRPHLVPMGSCTASTISELGYRCAEQTLRRLRAVSPGAELQTAIEESFRGMRADLRHMLARGQLGNLSVLMTPSGTDAELIAVLFASIGHDRRICNIIVGTNELGSGTLMASSCRFFDEFTPAGRTVTIGEPVDAALSDRIDCIELALRDPGGLARSTEDIDAQINEIVEERVGLGQHVLLHVTAHSKTGAHAPSLSLVAQLKQKHGDHIDIVVDAAQGRFSRRGLLRILQQGYLVIITGSKFYGGPPFAGALLIPEQFRARIDALPSLPSGFAHFLTRAQMPTSWKRLRASLPQTSNLGLLLRWSAAIEEMRRYYAIPSSLRLAVLRAFERLAPEVFGTSSSIQIDAVSPPIISDDYDRLLQSKTTVFTFRLWDDSRQCYFPREELKTIYDWMDTDLSRSVDQLGPVARDAMATLFQIGQPVHLGRATQGDIAALRIANGGVLISKIAEDLELGATLDARIDWLREQLVRVKLKLEASAEHFSNVLQRSKQIA